VIVPSGDPATMTDAEVLAGYAAIGITEDTALIYLRIIRAEPDPARPID
jgi:hypothetical protein